MINTLKMNSITIFSRTLILFLLITNFRFVSFGENPISCGTYSYFDVEFEWEIDHTMYYESRNLFGILLPDGWRVADKNEFTVTFSSRDPITAEFAYCQFYSDFMKINHPAPNGYYWWGGRAFDKIRYNVAETFSFTLRIFTDNKTGNFNLKYSFGDDSSNIIKDHYVSESITVNSIFENEFPIEKNYSWELISGAWNSQYYWDKDFDSFFLRYYGWNGGDIGISTLLPDGRSVWTWGDYHTGVVNSQRNRLSDLRQFPRNSLMVSNGTDYSSFKLITNNKVGEIEVPIVYKDDNGNEVSHTQEWYWPMGGSIYYRNGIPELQIVLEHQINTGGGGAWDMKVVSCDVAIFSLPNIQLREIVKNRYEGKAALANIIFKDDDGIIYIYGERNHGICQSATFVARNIDGDLAGDWEFYDGKNNVWSYNYSWEDNSDWLDYKIINNPVFVFKDGGKYYAFEQPACFGRDTYIFDAESPTGPFTNRRMVGRLPAEISTGNYFCYIPALHQQFSKDGELLYCVSKNNQNMGWYNYNGSGDIYLPHFFRVKNWRDKLSIVNDDITTDGGVLTAENSVLASDLIDKDETTIYSVSTESGKTWIQYESPEPLFLRRYTITSAMDAPEKDPLHWQMLGSKDGINWMILDERYYAKFEERSQTNCYTIQKDRTFTYFRLNILAINGSTELHIAELQFFGQYVDFEYLEIKEKEVEKDLAIIFPNPFSDYLKILSEKQNITSVKVYDINGRIIYSFKPQSYSNEIPTNQWEKGFYFVEVCAGNERVVKRVVKI